ncbi:MAG TPA: hypothetical protein VF720_11860, partial [Candidatus Eisenbacteria bacterium]
RHFPSVAFGAVVAALLSGCAPSEQEVDYEARKALLERQNQGLRELIAEAEAGTLVPADRFLVGVDESILKQVLDSQLPFEHQIGDKLGIRLERATVLLRDKYGHMTLEGEVHRLATPDRKTKVRIYGGLGAVSVDSTSNRLSVKIAVDRIVLVEAGLLDAVLGANGKKLLSEKGREILEDKLPVLQVPVALAQTIRVPAMADGPLQLDSLSVPLNLSVDRVLAAGGKLWLTIHAELGAVQGGEEGLGVSVIKKKKPKAS